MLLIYTRCTWAGGTKNRQITPRGYPNFNSYVKNLRVLVFQTDREINPVWASLTTSSCVKAGTPAARGLEELFSAVLERFLKPIHTLRVYCKN